MKRFSTINFLATISLFVSHSANASGSSGGGGGGGGGSTTVTSDVETNNTVQNQGIDNVTQANPTASASVRAAQINFGYGEPPYFRVGTDFVNCAGPEFFAGISADRGGTYGWEDNFGSYGATATGGIRIPIGTRASRACHQIAEETAEQKEMQTLITQANFCAEMISAGLVLDEEYYGDLAVACDALTPVSVGQVQVPQPQQVPAQILPPPQEPIRGLW